MVGIDLGIDRRRGKALAVWLGLSLSLLKPSNGLLPRRTQCCMPRARGLTRGCCLPFTVSYPRSGPEVPVLLFLERQHYNHCVHNPLGIGKQSCERAKLGMASLASGSDGRHVDEWLIG